MKNPHHFETTKNAVYIRILICVLLVSLRHRRFEVSSVPEKPRTFHRGHAPHLCRNFKEQNLTESCRDARFQQLRADVRPFAAKQQPRQVTRVVVADDGVTDIARNDVRFFLHLRIGSSLPSNGHLKQPLYERSTWDVRHLDKVSTSLKVQWGEILDLHCVSDAEKSITTRRHRQTIMGSTLLTSFTRLTTEASRDDFCCTSARAHRNVCIRTHHRRKLCIL